MIPLVSPTSAAAHESLFPCVNRLTLFRALQIACWNPLSELHDRPSLLDIARVLVSLPHVEAAHISV